MYLKNSKIPLISVLLEGGLWTMDIFPKFQTFKTSKEFWIKITKKLFYSSTLAYIPRQAKISTI